MNKQNKKRLKRSQKKTNQKGKKKAQKQSKEVNAVSHNIININLPEKRKNLVVRWIEKFLKVAGLIPIILHL